jgi:hypothetical protein
MDANQILASGGVSGTVGVLVYIIYKFASTHHRFRSACCGRTVDIETEVPATPEVKSQPLVEQDVTRTANSVTRSAFDERRSSTTSGKDKGTVSGKEGGKEEI